MAFFGNRAINLLNLHFAIHAIALYGGGAFFFVYFLRAGLSPANILAFFAVILLGRFLIRPAIVPLAARWGLRRLLMLGTLVVALQFPLLAQVDGIGPKLFALIVVTSIGDTIYWTTYHAYFASLGDQEHRGHQIGVREAVGAMIGVVSPLVAGLLLVKFGPQWAFGVTAVVQVLSALPLLRTPEVAVVRSAPGVVKQALPALLLFATDGWIQAGYVAVWQIGLFISLGEDYLAYGGALAAAALVGAIGGLVLGRHIDAGHGGRAAWLAIGVLMFGIAFRAAVLGNATLAVIANAAGALINCLYTPTLMTAIYNQAKRSACALRFHVAAEGAWDIGAASASLISAFLFSHGVSLSGGILLGLIGATGSLVLLRKYYSALLTSE